MAAQANGTWQITNDYFLLFFFAAFLAVFFLAATFLVALGAAFLVVFFFFLLPKAVSHPSAYFVVEPTRVIVILKISLSICHERIAICRSRLAPFSNKGATLVS